MDELAALERQIEEGDRYEHYIAELARSLDLDVSVFYSAIETGSYSANVPREIYKLMHASEDQRTTAARRVLDN